MPDDPLATADSLVGLLAEDARLRVVAALVLGARKTGDVQAATGLSPRGLAVALHRLRSGGLLSTVDGKLRLHAEVFAQVARAAATRAEQDHEEGAPRGAAVLRAFVRNGRLVQMPAVAGKRRVILEHIAAGFEPGVRYPEPAVNARLRAWYDDYASLRRYLVDAGLLSRESGEYWRTGGWVDTAAPPSAGCGPAGGAPAVREARLAAYALVEDGQRVLLSHYASGRLSAGRWTLPGGGVDFGERPVDAVVREVYEETGLAVRVTDLLDVDSEVLHLQRRGLPVESHAVRVLYRAEVTGGTLGVVEVGGSTDDARWWPREELTEDVLTSFAWSVLAAATGGR